MTRKAIDELFGKSSEKTSVILKEQKEIFSENVDENNEIKEQEEVIEKK